jgi:fermentation-respiration switch protein FrsA (DUF1100 family)
MSETVAAPSPRSRLRTALAILALRDRPFWGRSRPRRVARVLAFLVYLNLALLAVLLSLESRILFPGWAFSQDWDEPQVNLQAREVSLTSADGTAIHAWFTAPPGWRPETGAVLYSHGNGGNLSHRQYAMARWRNELKTAVLIYDYPGYGKSGGRPTEAGCYAAGEAAFAWLVDEQKVPPGEIVLLGSSLGGAVATELATRHEHALLVLTGAFTSFSDIAQKTVFWLPSRWLVSHRFDNLDKIARVKGPVLIAHGTDDRTVPFRMGERLFERANEPKCFVPLPGHPHAHPDSPVFFEAVRDMLTRTGHGQSFLPASSGW